MSFTLALVAVAVCGYVALSYEILWYRAWSFVSEGSPATFGVLLGAYLVGIAAGSIGSRRACRDADAAGKPEHLRRLAGFVFAANLVGFLVLPALARSMAFTNKWGPGLAGVALSTSLLGATFPLISHFGVRPDDDAGARISYLYLANIVGSSLGSLLTGFVFLDLFTLAENAVILAVAGVLLSAGLMLAGRPGPRLRWGSLAAAAAACAALVAAGPVAFDRFWERLHLKGKDDPSFRFAQVVETKSGVIAVSAEGAVWGGNVYDGIASVSLVPDVNHIVRVYALAAMHPAPKEVLVVGLATGASTRVLASLPGVERVTAIEINPGYLDVIRTQPSVASVLDDPKVEIVIDDGRRWLARNPDRRFDLVLTNTVWHWRDHATNLISTEWHELLRSRLAPGAVVMFQPTFSHDAALTALHAYPHALRFANLLLLSDRPVVPDRERLRAALTTVEIDGARVLDPSREPDRAALEHALGLLDQESTGWSWGVEDRERLLARLKGTIVTDDNMATEWAKPFRH